MKRSLSTWPRRFARWQFGSPFRSLPPAFGSPLPPDLRLFELQAAEAERHGIGGVAARIPAHHAKTRPARLDSALERQ
jgi:hypothetical protein